jgi:hypothetical protein
MRQLFNFSSILREPKSRQTFLTYFVAAAVIFLLFYNTLRILNGMIEEKSAVTEQSIKQIAVVQKRTQEAKELLNSEKTLETGLMSYVQSLSSHLGRDGKLVNIRLVSSQPKQEQVSFRSENLVYIDFLSILSDIEQYDNLWIKSYTLSKRFDNALRIDVVWDIVRVIG